MEEPPPPPMVRAPPALPDELVEEVLFRSPPDDPASLVRAALVCKRWSRLVSARAFRRRFRDFHLRRRAAPMLGFFRNVYEKDGSCRGRTARFSRLVRTSASCPPLNTPRGWLALDARGGRVLLHRIDAGLVAAIHLAVWDPLSADSGGHLELPVPILPRRPCSWNAALLCCDQHGLQDHADRAFRVVLVATDPDGAFACVYSSFGPAAWSELVYAAQHPYPGDVRRGRIDEVRGVLVGNALYFLLQDKKPSILKYDLATGDISVIPLTPASISYTRRMGTMVLTTTEDGDLGLAGMAGILGCKLHLWSMVLRNIGGALAMGFREYRKIDLNKLISPVDFLGFVEDVGINLMATNDGLISVDQKSGRTDKLRGGSDFYSDYIVPYMSFYTPALVTTSTDEGPSADA